MERIRVHSRRTTPQDGNLRVAFSVDGLDRNDGVDLNELWFEVNERSADFVDDGFDAAAVALLIPAMTAGVPLDVEGPMSARLEWNLNHHVVPLVRLAHPDLHDTKVTAEGREAGPPSVGGVVMTPLSNGVDSLTASLDHMAEDIPEEMRLTHFAFHTGGESLTSERLRRVFKARRERARETATEIGLPLVEVLSNVGDFDQTAHGKSHTLKNSTIPLLLQGRVESWFYASGGYSYSAVKVAPTHYIDSMDPLVLPMLSTETTNLAPTGTQYTRVEKTARVAEYPIAWKRLDVCVNSSCGENCSECYKCLRTLLTLELLGKLDRFADAFDLERYRKARLAYIPHVALSSDPILGEVALLMKNTGFRITPTMWRAAAVHAATRSRKSPIRLARRALELQRTGELSDTVLRRIRPAT